MREFIWNQLLPLLQQPLQIVLMALAAWVAVKIRRHIHNQDVAQLLVTLDDCVARSVADVYQSSVKAAKDAGGWTPEAQKAAKDAAIARVKQGGARVIDALRAAGENPEATLPQMVERAVVELNAKVRP